MAIDKKVKWAIDNYRIHRNNPNMGHKFKQRLMESVIFDLYTQEEKDYFYKELQITPEQLEYE